MSHVLIRETVDTVTFKDKENLAEMTVKREFLSKLKPEHTLGNLDIQVLFAEYMVPQYFHNTNGPAVRIIENGLEEYFIDGKALTEEESKRIENKISVQNDIQVIVNE